MARKDNRVRVWNKLFGFLGRSKVSRGAGAVPLDAFRGMPTTWQAITSPLHFFLIFINHLTPLWNTTY